MAFSDAILPARLRVLPREDLHVLLVLVLTLGTGAVDAVSYFSLDHVFTANMSGNMAILGIGVATNLGDVTGNIFAFVGFVAGSVLIGRFINRHVGTFMRIAVEALLGQLLIFVLLTVVVAFVDVAAHDGWRYAICLILAAGMGIQTGVARHLSVKDVNTTVATMTLHDLAAGSRLAGGDSVRWRRRAGVVLALFSGAAIAVGLDHIVRWGGLGFATLTVAFVLLAMAALLAAESREPSGVEDGVGRP
ncbi:MAG: hypothetical protein BGO11_19510 [Solirubrobacterales bacterium 70-9]|nr:MAG: hypothetical protein BGO11_19510 [Solirubrobacterales bacterium 70-9]